MNSQLVLTLEGIDKYYGDIPLVENYPNKYEEFSFSDDGIDEYLGESFAVPVNKECGCLLGYGDVDYLNAEKCKKLIPWIEKNIDTFVNPKGKEAVEKILVFAKRAVELNTGIIIEF